MSLIAVATIWNFVDSFVRVGISFVVAYKWPILGLGSIYLIGTSSDDSSSNHIDRFLIGMYLTLKGGIQLVSWLIRVISSALSEVMDWLRKHRSDIISVDGSLISITGIEISLTTLLKFLLVGLTAISGGIAVSGVLDGVPLP